MQKRKLLLSLAALCSIIGMGITSCNNEPVQGPQGEQGPVGPQGPAGENGENGEDGSLILHGEGKPADTLGKDTDIYIDSKTGDLYQKDNGTWTLVMNIKGEDGKDGEDGTNGSSGSDGQDGETAWSNTILPSTNILITQNVGSAIVGSDVIFTVKDLDTTDEDGIVGLTLHYLENETAKEISLDVIEASKDEDGSYTFAPVDMVKGGFVVEAVLGKNTTVDSSTSDLNDVIKATDGETSIINLGSDVTASSSFTFTSTDPNTKVIIDGGNKTIDLSRVSDSSAGLFNFASYNGDVEIRNLKIKGTASNSAFYFGRANNNTIGDIIIENVDFTESGSDRNIQLVTSSTRNEGNYQTIIRNNTFDSTYAIDIQAGTETLTYKNLTVEGNTFKYNDENTEQGAYINSCVALVDSKITNNIYNEEASNNTESKALYAFDRFTYYYIEVCQDYTGYEFSNFVFSNNEDKNPLNGKENEYYIDKTDSEIANTNYEWLYSTIMGILTNDNKNDIILEHPESGSSETNVFIDGALYKVVVYNDDGTINKDKSIKSEVAFSGGNGLSEGTALEISKDDQLNFLIDENVVESGASYFKLKNDITLSNALNITNRKETNINLNGHKLTINVENDLSTEILEGQTLSFNGGDDLNKKGKIEFTGNTNGAKANFLIKKGGNVKANNVTLISDGTPFLPDGDAASVEVYDSIVVGKGYAIGTNASGSSDYTVAITARNSTLIGWYGAGVLANIPSNVVLENCKIYGEGQAIFLRGGDMSVKDCDLYLAPKINSYNSFVDGNWGSGNSGPQAFILLGDKWNEGTGTTGYECDKNLILENVKFYQETELINETSPDEDLQTLIKKMSEPVDEDGTDTVANCKIYAYLTSNTFKFNGVDTPIKATLVIDELTKNRINMEGDTTEYYANEFVTVTLP